MCMCVCVALCVSVRACTVCPVPALTRCPPLTAACLLGCPLSATAQVEGWAGKGSGVGGNEGVGEVLQAGSKVSGLKKGDWVVPARPGVGTWRTHAVVNGDDLAAVSGDMPVEHAATSVVAPAVALRLLSDFADLKKGDVIVQNNAASTVGQAVIQIAAARGLSTVNILRQRDDHDDIVNHLQGLGAGLVVTEDIARTPAFKKLLSDLPGPKLGLNSVGGESATVVAKALGEGATLVTYGSSSRKPVTIPTSLLMSKDLTLRGFSLQRWMENASDADRTALVAEAAGLTSTSSVKQLLAREPFADFEIALKRAQEPSERKIVLVMD